MANSKHLDLLKQGCKEGYSVWNRWRKEEPETQADLSGANVSGANLRKANLQEANLSRANLSSADLRLANITYANLDYATLNNAILWETQRTGWSIKHVICTQVYWGENAQRATKYLPSQFSYLLAEKTKLVLHYEGGIKPIEVATLPSLIQQLELEHEGCILRLESIKVAPDGATVTIIVDMDEEYNVKQLEHSLTERAKQEQAWRRKALENYELRMQLEKQLIELNNLYLPLAKKRQESDPSLFQNGEEYLMVLFLDVAGFSRMNDVDRQEKVARLRDFGVPVLRNRGGKYINTWGDAIVAAFDDVNKGLICACQLISHLAIQGIPARIGINRGKVFIGYNSLTQRPDISGSTVNFTARLEPLAQKGEVLISEELRYEPTLDSNLFNFVPQKRALKKDLEGIEAGEFIDCYSVTLK